MDPQTTGNSILNLGEYLHFLNIERIFYLIYTLGGRVADHGFIATLTMLIAYVRPYGIALAVLFAIGIVYCRIRISQIRKEENERLYGETNVPEPAVRETEEGEVKNPRWKRVHSLMDSDEEGDWRRAILEADILLDEMLSNMGYAGESIGEKLKQVERSDFQSLDTAWEAHKMRNAIAHEGESFALTHRQARRVINLYEQVFTEFYYI